MAKPKCPKGRQHYPPYILLKAVELVQRRELSLQQASSFFRIPKTTIHDRISGKVPLERVTRTILSSEEERQLVFWLRTCANRGCGKTREELYLQVQRILTARDKQGQTSRTYFKDNKPGVIWFRGFMSRHCEIMEKKVMVLGEAKSGVSKGMVLNWFNKLQFDLNQDGINVCSFPASRIYNMDETGFPFYSQGSVIITDAENKHPYEVRSEQKSQITVLGCSCADGRVLRPMVLYPGARWTFAPEKDFPKADHELTPNGLINSVTFFKWLKYTFFNEVSHQLQTEQDRIILFVDGHTSHISMPVSDFCREKGIIFYVLPPSASHIVQPMDLVFFGQLKREWMGAVRDFKAITNQSAVTKATFPKVFASAWENAYTKDGIVNAFRASGICPWNPLAPDYSKCQPSSAFEVQKEIIVSAEHSAEAEPQPVICSASSPSQLLSNENSAEPSTLLNHNVSEAEPSPCNSPEQFQISRTEYTPLPQTVAFMSNPEPLPYTFPASNQHSSSEHAAVSSSNYIPGPESVQSSSTNQHHSPWDIQNIGFNVSRLVQHVIESGWDSADFWHIQRNQFNNVKPKQGETDYATYLKLWDSIVPPSTFDNLPIPQRSREEKKKRAVPPKYVSSFAFKEFHEKKAQNELKEERKREKEKMKQEKLQALVREESGKKSKKEKRRKEKLQALREEREKKSKKEKTRQEKIQSSIREVREKEKVRPENLQVLREEREKKKAEKEIQKLETFNANQEEAGNYMKGKGKRTVKKSLVLAEMESDYFNDPDHLGDFEFEIDEDVLRAKMMKI